MAQLFGAVTHDDISTFADSVGQQLNYTATQQYLAGVNADMEKALSVFVETTTEDYKERYQLPGGGTLQRRGLQTQVGAVKASGYWDTGYPLEDFGAAVSGDDVTLAYTSPAEYERHVQTVVIQNQNTVRDELLRRIFNNVATTFVDPRRGSITVQPLANGDSVLYPAVMGSTAEATENMYLESGYAANAISDTNNYIKTMVNKLTSHFGRVTGGANKAIFINSAQADLTIPLASVHEVPDNFLKVGSNITIPERLPNVPGQVIARSDHGAWIIIWDWIPDGWALAVDLEQPAPIKMRVDPASTGLGRGLQLVATSLDYPFRTAFWRHRFGFGVGNRLNGVVMEFGTGGTYSIPSAYA